MSLYNVCVSYSRHKNYKKEKKNHSPSLRFNLLQTLIQNFRMGYEIGTI